jgi:DNA mismatch repair ATPase MutL
MRLKNKYNSIKKYLPELGFEMSIAHESVLRIDAVPEGLKETQVMKFLENLFEILEYKTEEEFMQYYQNQWNKMQSKSRFDFIYKKDAEQLIKDFTALGFPEFLPNGKDVSMKFRLMILKTNFKAMFNNIPPVTRNIIIINVIVFVIANLLFQDRL